jgi:hypothetical protein
VRQGRGAKPKGKKIASAYEFESARKISKNCIFFERNFSVPRTFSQKRAAQAGEETGEQKFKF